MSARKTWLSSPSLNGHNMNTAHRKKLPGTDLDYFDARAVVDGIEAGRRSKAPSDGAA